MELYYFTSTTCKACHSFEPVVKDLCQKYGLDFYHLDVMEDVKEVCKYGILSLPTTIILDSEGERKRFIGKTSELQKWLSENLDPLARPRYPTQPENNTPGFIEWGKLEVDMQGFTITNATSEIASPTRQSQTVSPASVQAFRVNWKLVGGTDKPTDYLQRQ